MKLERKEKLRRRTVKSIQLFLFVLVLAVSFIISKFLIVPLVVSQSVQTPPSIEIACSATEPCPNYQCCSKWGFCGISPDYCTDGCLSQCDLPPMRFLHQCGPSPDNPPGPGYVKKIAMTFDDGPSIYTPGLLDTLQEKQINVTFFVLGQAVSDYPSTLARAYNEGHQIEIHGWNHYDFTTLTEEEIMQEIYTTSDEIESITGYKPKFFRPPYGAHDQRTDLIISEMGYPIILWNLDSLDHTTTNPNEVFANYVLLLNQLDPDPSIALQHDIAPHSVQEVGNIIDYIRSKGYELVTIDQCEKNYSNLSPW